MPQSDLGTVVCYCGLSAAEAFYAPALFLSLPGNGPPVVSAARQIDNDTWDYYDPSDDDDDEDIWVDPGPPDIEPVEYPPLLSVSNSEFSIFTVGYCYDDDFPAASYPYQMTENAKPVFKYTVCPDGAGGTDFIVEDNIGEFVVHIDEILYGHFCSLMVMWAGFMSIKVWGGDTSEPYEVTGISTRRVTFDHSKICRVE